MFILFIAGMLSCGTKSVEPACATDWGTEVHNELTTLYNAASAYATDNSTANCTKYKDAYKAYLKKLRSFSNCSLITGPQRKALEEAIQEAESEIDSLC